MSQRDLAAELRASRVAAPDEVRERVRLIAVDGTPPPRRFTWRRAFVVALPVAVVAGSLCGTPGYLRITYAIAEELFEKAITQIKESLQKLRRRD